MSLYALTVFISAFLLFLLQLIAAKQILPWFGGSAAVWVTCLVFFQCGLLLGYVYADWSSRRIRARQQVVLHAILLLISLALLPLIPDLSWKPTGNENPAGRILVLLSVTIGLPYFLLSTTSPLVQSWFVRTYPNTSPYRLFALSNFASLLALLSYPLVIEPWLTTTRQAHVWAVLYGAFAVVCGATAWHSLRAKGDTHAPMAPQLMSGEATERPPAPGSGLLWFTLAAMGSLLLLAVTNHLSQNIAAIPLLWVVPLSIYLLTFILCFDGRNWYRRNFFLGLLAVFLCAMAWVLADISLAFELKVQLGLFSAGLFVACMFCHGELYRSRPAARYLTRFYLMIALGGAVGALLVGIVAPLIFPGFYELEMGLAGLAAIALFQVRKGNRAVMVAALGVLAFTLYSASNKIIKFTDQAIAVTRNFYGVLRVHEYSAADVNYTERMLVHGLVTHGNQYPYGRWRRTPTTYFTTQSGIGRTLLALQQPNARVGIVGLGVGTIAAYGRPGDTYRFYELDPAVVQVAQQEFTYLKDSAAKIEIVLGDARLSLEREPSQQYYVLAVDAFSGDAIPVHLLTREAMAVYLKHLKPRGVIAFHVTNLFLDLAPVVQQLADTYNLKVAYISEKDESSEYASKWVLLTRDQAFLDLHDIRDATSAIPLNADSRLWTDDFSNLVRVLKK